MKCIKYLLVPRAIYMYFFTFLKLGLEPEPPPPPPHTHTQTFNPYSIDTLFDKSTTDSF